MKKTLFTVMVENGPTAADSHPVIVKAKTIEKAKEKAAKIWMKKYPWTDIYISCVFETRKD